MPGVTVTVVTKGSATGRVTFRFAGRTVTRALKRGKASVRLPSQLAPGRYTVRARLRQESAAASTKVVVHDSALTLPVTDLTLSVGAECAADPVLSGSVVYKGTVPTEGWIDIYRDGNVAGGTQSPDFMGMAGLLSDGSFVLRECDPVWRSIEALGAGTHRFTAVFTPTSPVADHLRSGWFQVTVVA